MHAPLLLSLLAKGPELQPSPSHQYPPSSVRGMMPARGRALGVSISCDASDNCFYHCSGNSDCNNKNFQRDGSHGYTLFLCNGGTDACNSVNFRCNIKSACYVTCTGGSPACAATASIWEAYADVAMARLAIRFPTETLTTHATRVSHSSCLHHHRH